ncbi:phosphoglyceromutase [Sediminibacterium goheungense]|uniref:Phosphopentomutase/2, 3-bisphosphoglycerate-independent phosphoglycerate mutase family metalloenzyme n=1 Tax=Sediminibacterium goheungense TaxID=1086393 RepID=A0A4R6IYC0_9BACT|nr:phosphoglyceromutase [Sediminibacterium goheungense]TDO26875.1 phosphopentomutase/2,3-bisphosphoglycerate-independent phosphoglycerate mutase family metalloenzyme [Sediminibacterium goheungense]
MQKILLSVFTFLVLSVQAQKTENIIIITTDGLRWQELFKGMDETIARDSRFNQDDSAAIFKEFGGSSESQKRKKLMPFLWNTLAIKGQLYGNRTVGSNVNVSNRYWFSYPGYNEILSGYADDRINSNDYAPNPNTTITEFFNQQPALKGKVGAFGAWEAFNRILNEQRSGVPVVAAYDTCGGKKPNTNELMINKLLRDSHKQWGEECFDVFTHHAAMEYLKKEQPRVMYIAYGETDEWAHSWKYKYYLTAARQVDNWIGEIWNYIQSTPAYKDKTTLFITTDHGRGDKDKSKWTSHGSDIEGADEIWFAVMGPDTAPLGEIRNSPQLYQKQFAQTIAKLMGYTFKADQPIADAIKEVIKN